MSSITLNPPIPRTRARAYSEDQWGQKKALFSRLYRDKGKSLRDVQAILAEEYGFHPAVAMLKTRIQKWGLDRKKKQPDMLYALRIVLERQALRKDTSFVIRDRVVKSDDIKRYKRKGVLDLQALLRESPAADATTEIECHTPETVATFEIPETNVQALAAPDLDGNRVTGGNLEATLDPGHVDSVVSSTQEMNHLDALLYHSRVYYDSVFQTSTWHDSFSRQSLRPSEGFYDLFLGGQAFLYLGFVPSAFCMFNLAFNEASLLLTQQHILSLLYFYSIILPNRVHPGQEVLVQLFRFIMEKVQTRHSQMHCIHRSMSIINRLSISDRGEASSRVFQAIFDRLRMPGSNDSKPLEIDPNTTYETLGYSGRYWSLGFLKPLSAAVQSIARKNPSAFDVPPAGETTFRTMGCCSCNATVMAGMTTHGRYEHSRVETGEHHDSKYSNTVALGNSEGDSAESEKTPRERQQFLYASATSKPAQDFMAIAPSGEGLPLFD
ncbi:hypothetical protein G647_07784 [Cladophialophora carrionii CBS 160.54]|uniref:Clr5 domain-containing protein n=1 Tax=Cladophialophora carrionii CBS 160.54 TaxID=1279043 RepID=V9D637_9EURO|nr:uncharacterized protein G647_07784 [Cladophialophora carrionii CBS 160.54]ETI21437.1 hypothetical protein G647_07784 [Cladophialophora carrionii CBS 160.54]